MHFERFRDHKYLGAWDLEDGDITVIMDRVEQGVIEKPGRDPERVPLLFLRDLDGRMLERPLVVNHTNGTIVKMLYGSSDVRTWPGKAITLTTGLTTNTEGQPCLGIRVKMIRPEIPSTPATEAERIAKLEAELAVARAAAAQRAPAPSALAAPSADTVSRILDAELVEVPHGKVA